MKYCPKLGQICDKNCAFYDDYTQLCMYIAQTRALVDIAKALDYFKIQGIQTMRVP